MDCFQWRRTAAAPYSRGGRKVEYAAGVPPPSNGDSMALPTPRTKFRSELFRAAAAGKWLGVLALALMLCGCDNCGDWFGISKSQAIGPDACRKQAPPPQ